MKIIKQIIAFEFLFLLIINFSEVFAETVKPNLDIPANSRSIETLRRIQTHSALLFNSQAFPQSNYSVEKYLQGKDLTSSDSAILSLSLIGFRNPLIQWTDSVSLHSLYFSPAINLAWHNETQPDSNDGARLVGFGGTLYGNLNPHLTFYSHGFIYSEFTDKAQFTHQFSSEYGETYSVEKGANDSLLKNRTYNRFESYVLAGFSWITLKLGRDRVHMGPGYFSSLMATRDTPPYYLLEARIDFASWLTLDNYLLRMTDTRHDIQKYANLHRFEFKPSTTLSLAFQDIVIYQDRDPDWRYILPLVPLTFTESDIGGPDNAAMGFDFLYAGIKNFSLWGELFIDDLMGPTSFFNDFWENRWAGLAGVQVTSPLPKFDADLVIEYSHVEPWTYNGRKPQTSFKQFNVPSASKLGPDSRTWDIQLSYRPIKWIEIKEGAKFYDKGLERAGTLGVIHNDAVDGLTKNWLNGNVYSQRIWTQKINFHLRQFLSTSLICDMDFGDIKKNQMAIDFIATW